MSDSPLFALALGSLAASRGASDLAHVTASFFSPPDPAPTIDLSGVRAAAAEFEAHIARQDEYIARLNAYIDRLLREVQELRQYARKVEDARNELMDWAALAEAELKRRRAADGDRSQ